MIKFVGMSNCQNSKQSGKKIMQKVCLKDSYKDEVHWLKALFTVISASKYAEEFLKERKLAWTFCSSRIFKLLKFSLATLKFNCR